jgi:hypothetical protein
VEDEKSAVGYNLNEGKNEGNMVEEMDDIGALDGKKENACKKIHNVAR